MGIRGRSLLQHLSCGSELLSSEIRSVGARPRSPDREGGMQKGNASNMGPCRVS